MEVSDVSSTNSEFKLIPQAGFNISQKWLETQSHKNLKAIASEFSIEVVDKRSKLNYINAILVHTASSSLPNAAQMENHSVSPTHSKINC
jgi:hypothetical protein